MDINKESISRKISVNSTTIFYWITILFVIILPIISVGDNLGLYFDSVFPDYLAVQILNPQKYQVDWSAAFPYLTQVYHGTVSLWISLFATLVTGKTSILQHRIVFSFVILGCLLLLDRIFVQNSVNIYLRRGGIFVIALTPTLITFTMTQYYIELPGTLFLLFAVLLYEKAEKISNKDQESKTFFFSFFMMGLAFYNYFNYLFFAPGMIFFYILHGESKKDRIRNLLISIYGILSGAVFYFSGDTTIILNQLQLWKMKQWLPILVWILIWGISGIMFCYLRRSLVKIPLIISLLSLVVIASIMIMFRGTITDILTGLSVAGYYEADVLQRIGIVWRLFCGAVTGNDAENLILGESVTNGMNFLPTIFIVLSAFYIIKMVVFPQTKCRNIVWKYLIVGISYLAFCIILATRMQTQHFVPLFFWMVMLLILEIDQLLKPINIDNHYISFAPFKGFALLGGIILSFFLLQNRQTIVHNIVATGGCNYYTNQLNVFSEEALKNVKTGEKELYLFPEWGFMAGFNYLTNNMIPFSTNCDLESISNYLEEGFDVCIMAWESNGQWEEYVDLLKKANCNNVQIESYLGSDGRTVFYKLIGNR